MFELVKNPFKNPSDAINPLIVFEFRRAYRNYTLQAATLLFFLAISGAAYFGCVFSSNVDSEAAAPIAMFVMGFCGLAAGMNEGIFVSDQTLRLKDELFKLNGLSSLEKYHGRIALSFLYATWFACFLFPPLLIAGLVRPMFFLALIPFFGVFLFVLCIRLMVYALFPPYRQSWENAMQLITAAIIFIEENGVLLLGLLWPFGLWSAATPLPGWLLISIWAGTHLLVLPPVSYFLTRYYITDRRVTCFQIALTNVLLYTGILLLVLAAWTTLLVRSF